MHGVDAGVVVPHLVAVHHRPVRRAQDAAGVVAAARPARDHRRPVGEPVPGEPVAAVHELGGDRALPRALLGAQLRVDVALQGGVDHHVEHRQEAQELAAVAEPGHAVEFAALLAVQHPLVVALVGYQDGLRRRPVLEVAAGGYRDQAACEPVAVPAPVEGEELAAVRSVRHRDRLQDLVARVQHRVGRVLGPVDAVGRVRHPVAALRLPPLPRHHAVAFRRRRRRVDDHGGAVLVEHDDVVVGGAVERVPPEAGLVPVHAVLGGGVQHHVALPLLHARRAVFVAAPDARQVPHAEAPAVRVVVHRAVHVHPLPLPWPVRHQHRLRPPPPRMQRAYQAALRGHDAVVHEQLRNIGCNGRGPVHGTHEHRPSRRTPQARWRGLRPARRIDVDFAPPYGVSGVVLKCQVRGLPHLRVRRLSLPRQPIPIPFL